MAEEAAAAAAQPAAAAISDGHHPHPLLLRTKPRAFRCDRCKCDGFGRRYVCRECKLCFHELCATCPDSILFFMHPDHPLTLQRSHNPFTRHTCEACGDPAHGYFYRCKPCSFELHPFCSLVPPTVADDAHPGHTLAYVHAKTKTPCAVCGEGCAGWRYACRECPAHVHMKCLSVVGGAASDGGGDEGAKKGNGKKIAKTALMVAGGVGVVLAVVLAVVAGEEAPDLNFDFGGGEMEIDDFGFDFEGGEEAEVELEEVAEEVVIVAEVEAELEAAAVAEVEAEHEAVAAPVAEANEAEAENQDEDSSDSSDEEEEEEGEEEEAAEEEEKEKKEKKEKKKSSNPFKSFLKAMAKGDKKKKDKEEKEKKEKKKKDKKIEDETDKKNW